MHDSNLAHKNKTGKNWETKNKYKISWAPFEKEIKQNKKQQKKWLLSKMRKKNKQTVFFLRKVLFVTHLRYFAYTK